jgi:CubicO group peptidase (beta-lactamase class C family)
MRFAVVCLSLGILVQFTALAEDVAPQKVDQIFSVYDKAGSPGCSLGVIRDGDFVYRKAYGSANLELGVPLSPQSVFYMGSVSKQFTAAALVLAAEQGFLLLDDDVRKYVPELADYGHVVTLRQMLHHTSGFRDFFDLIDLSGRDVSDFNSPGEILKIVARQRGLNNIPGDEWLYSNTNYFLLGVVVKSATKKSLAEFATQNIFSASSASDSKALCTTDQPLCADLYRLGRQTNLARHWLSTQERDTLYSARTACSSWQRQN